MKKLLLIYNAKSGKGLIKNFLVDIIDIFIKAKFRVEIYQTQKAGDATEKIAGYASEFDEVVVCGGDGTLNEAFNGLMKVENTKRPVLGYIPAGSTNDFGNTLGLPKDMIKAAEIAVTETPMEIDAGMFQDKTFAYVAAFGAFTDVSYQTPQDMKNMLGHGAYIIEGIKSLVSLRDYGLKCISDGRVIEGKYIYGMVSNSDSVGGFKNIPGLDISLSDGMFEVTLVKMPKNPVELNMIAGDLLSGKAESGYVIRFKSEKVTFEFEEKVAWTIDGESGGEYENVDITNVSRAIKIRTV